MTFSVSAAVRMASRPARRRSCSKSFSNGETGPAICLLSLFQAYDAAVAELEDRDIAGAAADSRARAEQELEASRWALR
jgi:hypothetical protein